MQVKRLAKLSDMKSRLRITETGLDTQFGDLIEQATSIAVDELIGHEVRRKPDVTEYPSDVPERGRRLYLDRSPIESITSIKQLYSPGSTADFTAEDALTIDDDFFVVDPGVGDQDNRGILDRIYGEWYRRGRCIQAVYTGGFCDPQTIADVDATTGFAWTAATNTLAYPTVFGNYTFTPGDAIVISGGTGATLGTYRIASKTSDVAIVLVESISASNLTNLSITLNDDFTSLIEPPADLQDGIIQQAIRMWQTFDAAGGGSVSYGGRGGVVDAQHERHPALIAACKRLRRIRL